MVGSHPEDGPEAALGLAQAAFRPRTRSLPSEEKVSRNKDKYSTPSWTK